MGGKPKSARRGYIHSSPHVRTQGAGVYTMEEMRRAEQRHGEDNPSPRQDKQTQPEQSKRRG